MGFQQSHARYHDRPHGRALSGFRHRAKAIPGTCFAALGKACVRIVMKPSKPAQTGNIPDTRRPTQSGPRSPMGYPSCQLRSNAMFPFRLTLIAIGMALGQSACAVADAPQGFAASSELRLLLKTVGEPDKQQLVFQVSRSAALPVEAIEYVAAAGGPWHAISLRCVNASSCESSLGRLRADTAHFAAVEVDTRRNGIPRSKAP